VRRLSWTLQRREEPGTISTFALAYIYATGVQDRVAKAGRPIAYAMERPVSGDAHNRLLPAKVGVA
jgi:hypothetical protein